MPTMKDVIIITGASQRVGLASAKHFKLLGHDVLVSFRTHRPAIDELIELGIECIQADFTRSEDINNFIKQIYARCTSIRAIIHNASEWPSGKDGQHDLTLLNRMMQIHVNAPYQINLACQSLLERNEHSADIIHMTDYITEKGSAKRIAYAASKAALENMNKSFAALMAPAVKVNAIAPSLVMFNEDDDDAYRQRGLNKSLMQLEPGAEEVIHCIEYILNSQYVTGRTLHLDGGRQLK